MGVKSVPLAHMAEGHSATEENGVRLAASKLMDAHHAFYQRMGPLAWNVVPDYISANAFVASCYVKLILSYIKDLIRVRHLIVATE